jgi:hypothetical protein
VCTSRSTKDPNNDYITLQTDLCKKPTISWLCCRSSSGDATRSDCTLDSCNTPEEAIERDKNKCNSVSSLKYIVPSDATSVLIQLHDGRFQGNRKCSNNVECCGGSNSACATSDSSGVCEVTINLSNCPVVVDPEPICTVNSECSSFNADCARGICKDGDCQQVFLGGMTCRSAVTGPDGTTCDAEEVCVDGQTYCPDDVYLPINTPCRLAVIGEDGTTCDAEEVCSGSSNYCPVDGFLPSSTVCRPKATLCDIPENCNGVQGDCPTDLFYDFAYTYKCSTTQYLCAVTRTELRLGAGNAYFFGSDPNSCGIGTARAFVDLHWPECVHQCIKSVCPNERDLSNYAVGHCVTSSGQWSCDTKVNVDVNTTLPYCPSNNCICT